MFKVQNWDGAAFLRLIMSDQAEQQRYEEGTASAMWQEADAPHQQCPAGVQLHQPAYLRADRLHMCHYEKDAMEAIWEATLVSLPSLNPKGIEPAAGVL